MKLTLRLTYNLEKTPSGTVFLEHQEFVSGTVFLTLETEGSVLAQHAPSVISQGRADDTSPIHGGGTRRGVL
jgi:hypothetical protein